MHEHDGRTFEEAFIAHIDLLQQASNIQFNSVTSGYLMLSNKKEQDSYGL
jgi:hypothetical protein